MGLLAKALMGRCPMNLLLQGVDNGQMWFKQARVPRDALLDAYASVAPDGTYSSKIPSVSARFGVTVGGLTTGEQALLVAPALVPARAAYVRLCFWLYSMLLHNPLWL